jgi:polygalacturonase
VSVAAVVDGETYADSTYMNTLVDAINQGQSGVVNALIDGVVADGVTDNTAAMQVAIDRALDGSGPATAVAYIDLPAGDIAIDGPLDIPFVTGFE